MTTFVWNWAQIELGGENCKLDFRLILRTIAKNELKDLTIFVVNLVKTAYNFRFSSLYSLLKLLLMTGRFRDGPLDFPLKAKTTAIAF